MEGRGGARPGGSTATVISPKRKPMAAVLPRRPEGWLAVALGAAHSNPVCRESVGVERAAEL
jgi:hypothetical protein